MSGGQLKRAWRALNLLAHTDAAGPRPDWGARPHRVLFLRQDRIGDMIVSTGLLRAISAAHPTISLDVLASPSNAPIIRSEPYVNTVHVMDKPQPWMYAMLIRQLRRVRYDAVIDGMVSPPWVTEPSRSAVLLMVASGARYRIGVAGRGLDDVLSIPVPPRSDAPHLIDQMATLATAFGIDPAATDFRPRLTLSAAERAEAEQFWLSSGAGAGTRRLLVNVSAGWEGRQWPAERFVATLRELHARHPDLRTLVIGAPAEAERIQLTASGRGAQVAPTPRVRQAMALVATADLVLTPDTSITHAASAFDKPAVVMFNRGISPTWGVYHTPGRNVEGPGDTLDSLPTAPVLAAREELLPAQTPKPTEVVR